MEGIIVAMHLLVCHTIDPLMPATPGPSTSSSHRSGGHCLCLARSAVGCSASRMKGELHLANIRLCEADFGPLCVLSCIWMTASNESKLFVLLCVQ